MAKTTRRPVGAPARAGSVALAGMLVATTPAWSADEHVRSSDQWVLGAIEDGKTRSTTFSGLVARVTELLPLGELAKEFRVHIRTLQAAVRTGRLAAHFSVKSVFGRPRG